MAESIKSKYLDIYKQEYFVSRGCYWRTQDRLEAAKEIYQTKCYEDDIWLCTYPKSGTMWVRMVIIGILHKGDRKSIENDIETKVFKPMEITPAPTRHKLLTSSPPRGVLVTHVPFSYFPVQAFDQKAKVIYAIRNPKDVAVSYYHFHRMNKLLGNYQGTFSEFLQYFMKGETSVCSWFDHVLNWWQQRESHPNILFIKYEDMKKNLQSQIKIISEYLGYTLDQDAISNIQEFCQFENMATNTSINHDLYKDGHLDKNISPFLRKGEVGDWKNHFTEEESKRFDELFKERMQGTGLDIEFDH